MALNPSFGVLKVPAAKLLISLPQDLVTRLRSSVPHKQRSRVIQLLIEAEVKKREDQLYQAALTVEKDSGLEEDMALWDIAIGDGLHDAG